jgi:mutator protein MutT
VRVDVVAAIIRREGRILITQRLANADLGNLWEFPGGKVRPGEALEVALQREINEELGVQIQVDGEFFKIEHDYPTKSIRLFFFNCTIVAGEERPLEVADLRWVDPLHLENFQFPAADAELIAKLRLR